MAPPSFTASFNPQNQVGGRQCNKTVSLSMEPEKKYLWKARNIQPPHISETVQLHASLRMWRQYGFINSERDGVNEHPAKREDVWVLGKRLHGTEMAVTFPEEARIFLSSEMSRPALCPTRLQINVNTRLFMEGKAAEAWS
jgi:hypothetical protein